MPTNITFGGMALRSFGYTLGGGTNAYFLFGLEVGTSGLGGVNSQVGSTVELANPVVDVINESFVFMTLFTSGTTYEVIRVNINSLGSLNSVTNLTQSAINPFSANTVTDLFASINVISANFSGSVSNGLLQRFNNVQVQSAVKTQTFLPISITGQGVSTCYDSTGIQNWALYNYKGDTDPAIGGIFTSNSVLYKYNNALTYQASYIAPSFVITDMLPDSAGNLYVVGLTRYAAQNCNAYVRKWPATGFIPAATWNKYIYNDYTSTGTATSMVYALGVDSSDAVYVVAGTGSTIVTQLIKFDSSGVEQWKKTFNTSVNPAVSRIVFDGSGNLYFAYDVYTASPVASSVNIAKFACADGTAIFFRTLSTSTAGYGVYCGSSAYYGPQGWSNSFLKVSGSTMFLSCRVALTNSSNGGAQLLLKVPTNGALTQSNFTLSSYTMSYTTATVTVNNSTVATGTSTTPAFGFSGSGSTDTTITVTQAAVTGTTTGIKVL